MIPIIGFILVLFAGTPSAQTGVGAVAGFQSKAACETAGQQWSAALSAAGSGGGRYICFPSALPPPPGPEL